MNRVLVVDDSEGVRMTMTAILEDAGYAVSEAGSLAEARALLRGRVYELVILDMMLEDGVGTELIPAVRSALPAAKVVMFSGGDDQDIGKAADLTLAKGDDPMEIVRRLAALFA